MIEDLIKAFEEKFGGAEEARLFFAPGRINLIGEHTDYNGGYVLPCAIEMGTYCAARSRDDRIVRMYSDNFPETGIMEWKLDELEKRAEAGWSNYSAGMLWAMEEKDFIPEKGFDVCYLGDIPNQSGLSSSASIEVVTGYAIKSLFQMDIPLTELALMGQKAENIFVGMGCGIMDQFSAAMSRQGHATFLNSADLSYEYVPVELGKYSLMIMNTCKQRELTDSKYNERLAECRRALFWLQNEMEIDYLCDLTEEQFEEFKDLIEDETERKRAKHVVYENARTIKAKALLEEGDLAGLGKLLDESHVSLHEDYEVTGIELDTLVAAAWEQDGVLGARMTGAGFGGCAICIAETEKTEDIARCVGEIYAEKIGYEAEFYVTHAGGGAKEITSD